MMTERSAAIDVGTKIADPFVVLPIVRAFRESFRRRGSKFPTWVVLDNPRPIDPSEIAKITPPSEDLYLLNEAPSPRKCDLRSITFNELVRFSAVHDDTYGNAYVFPKDMTWCIAFTGDDDMEGKEVVLLVENRPAKEPGE